MSALIVSSLYSVFVQVKRTYSHGTYRAGAMRQISLVGAVDEEVGDYFPEFLGMLQQSPFLEVSILDILLTSLAKILLDVNRCLLCCALFTYIHYNVYVIMSTCRVDNNKVCLYLLKHMEWINCFLSS